MQARLLPAALMAGLLAAGTAAGAAGAAGGAGSRPAISSEAYENRVQRRINEIRADRGLRALRLAGCTDHVAERWSVHLAESNRFYHQSMRKALERCDATYAAETLGRGAMGPSQLVRMWMDSPGHHDILLTSKARRIGVGATLDPHGRWVVVANFMRF